MYQRDEIIEQLGIEKWPEINQDKAVELAIYRIGSDITKQLNEQQFNEYSAIVDGNTEVIDGWLANNIPDYKESPVFQEFEASYADDPEKNSPEKLFTSTAWIQQNVPELQELIAKTLATFKQELSTAS